MPVLAIMSLLMLLADRAAHDLHHVIDVAPEVGRGKRLEAWQEATDGAGASHVEVDGAELHAFRRFLLGAELAVGEQLQLQRAVGPLQHELGHLLHALEGGLAGRLDGREFQHAFLRD